MSQQPVTKVGLRIDVDTYRGTRLGVPKLLSLFAKHDIKASFFFTVGPDNMGRHIWRLLRPAFLKKMLRSKAASLYGWDILIRGTLWPGPIIGKKLKHIISAAHQAGHEMGLHSWDHHKWQMKTDFMSAEQLHDEIKKGHDLLTNLIGESLSSSAVAGWRCTEQTLVEKQKFAFQYNSDCRGESIFIPGKGLTPQIPVTLPTYDELIGQGNIDQQNYNDEIIKRISSSKLNVYTIHAEVEGIVCADMFEELIVKARAQNIEFVPLIELLDDCDKLSLPQDSIVNIELEGREGWLTHQRSMVEKTANS
ncbi:4-deoxy-4-formamido-L-arabinose-phosphoundecaprenol deformylase [Shewanella intestini]|uniref:Probable 4-deoxy-4-formamido-L-arabinose-phosphoundecaprenol deformylase ArnD n=1 Tax=Shewanella intestini TaxID=2017544 RepID=A0ABS5I462_9GAMM|nr:MULTISPECIES: 4-deoxy-4-formamido-L-arabinose-phosphoundecaprenol deformylase [Shewanella]MBR9728824.1 4-deoxy-4-formamido-L-arabinose-phosphoundecaprenol deformylase [Shewanella intestini]MRG37110.1 4-deoxy-4-formamido-L-arabinose-phosphoundecaprenol deformylase [Shewanella sp. XMDDZSB0408]